MHRIESGAVAAFFGAPLVFGNPDGSNRIALHPNLFVPHVAGVMAGGIVAVTEAGYWIPTG